MLMLIIKGYFLDLLMEDKIYIYMTIISVYIIKVCAVIYNSPEIYFVWQYIISIKPK